MRRITVILAIALLVVLAAATTAAPGVTAAPAKRSVNACLRAHGWRYGLRALLRAEIRVRHPNGLVAICTRGIATSHPECFSASRDRPWAVRRRETKRARGRVRSSARTANTTPRRADARPRRGSA